MHTIGTIYCVEVILTAWCEREIVYNNKIAISSRLRCWLLTEPAID